MTSPSSRIAGRCVGVTVLALALASTLVAILLATTRPGVWERHELVTHLYFEPVQLAFGLVGAAILLRWPRHPVGWLFGALGLLLGLGQLATPWVAWDLPGSGVFAVLLDIMSVTVIGTLALSLLLFPTGRPPTPRWRWVVWLVLGQVALGLTITLLGNPPGWAGNLESAASFVVALGLLLVAIASLVARWRAAAGDERQQVRWLALAGILFGTEIAIGLLTMGLGEEETRPVDEYVGNAIFALTLISIPVAMGFAITRFGLYDIDRLISRALTYGAMAVAIGALYVAAVTLVGGVLTRRPGVSLTLGLAVTVLAAVTFHPVRSWLLDRIEHWVYGARADRYAVMSDLGHGLSHTVGPDEVLARVAEAAGVAVRAQGAEVCVRTSSRPAVRATWGRPMAATTPGVRTERVAIVVDDDEVGEVLVLDPSGLPSDRALLGRIVELARPAVRNLVLLDELDALRATLDRQNAEIAASQTRLVRAAEEERRRLHDLVVSRLLPRIAALRTAVADAPATRRRDRSQGYAVLAAESSELARDVRAMAHDVLPPLLGDRGLVPALRSLVRDADRDVMLDTTGFTPADRLTSEVESALYLACRAALEHVSGDEGTTSVRLTHAGERVGFDVRGRGAAGPGELELAGDRVIALGGQVRVVEHADSRQVTGMLPIGGVQRAGGAAIPG